MLIFNAKRTVGRITGINYTPWYEVTRFNCKHENFVIDNKTKTYHQTCTTDYPMHLMVIALIEAAARKKWIDAEAECNECRSKFYVSASYKSKWSKKKIVDVIDTWTIIKTDGKIKYIY